MQNFRSLALLEVLFLNFLRRRRRRRRRRRITTAIALSKLKFGGLKIIVAIVFAILQLQTIPNFVEIGAFFTLTPNWVDWAN